MNRREAMAARCLGTGTALVAVQCATADAVDHDPMRDLVRRFNAANDFLNASDIEGDKEVDAYCAAYLDPLLDEMRDNPPPVTTEAGAIETLKLATNTGRLPDPEIIESLGLAVLDFLEGRA